MKNCHQNTLVHIKLWFSSQSATCIVVTLSLVQSIQVCLKEKHSYLWAWDFFRNGSLEVNDGLMLLDVNKPDVYYYSRSFGGGGFVFLFWFGFFCLESGDTWKTFCICIKQDIIIGQFCRITCFNNMQFVQLNTRSCSYSTIIIPRS